MPADEEIMNMLLQLGLTKYGAKTYHALLEMGEAGAGDIARRTGVPRNRVYDTLDELSNEGLVEMVLDEPRVYRPLPVEGWIDRRIQAIETDAQRFRERKSEISELVRALNPPSSEAGAAPGSIKLVKGNAANDVLLLDLFSKCEKSLHAALTAGTALRALVDHDTREALEGAIGRGADVRIVIMLNDQTADVIDKVRSSVISPVIRVARNPLFHVARVVQDGKQLYLRQPVGTDLGSRAEVGFLTDKDVLVLDAADYVNHLWETGETIEERLRAIATGKPSEWEQATRDIAAGTEDVLNAMRQAKREILTMTDDPLGFPGEHTLRITQEVYAAAARGVKFRLLTRITQDTVHLFENVPSELGEIRHHDRPDFRFQIVDDLHLSETIAANADGTGLMVSSTIRQKIQGFRQFFEERWRLATPLPDRLEQLRTGHEPPRMEIYSAYDRQFRAWHDLSKTIRASVESVGSASQYVEHGERQIASVRERIARGVQYRFVVLGGGLPKPLLQAYLDMGVEVRYIDVPHMGGFVLVDRRAALAAPYCLPANASEAERAFLWVTEDASAVRFLVQQFDAYWEKATPVTKA